MDRFWRLCEGKTFRCTFLRIKFHIYYKRQGCNNQAPDIWNSDSLILVLYIYSEFDAYMFMERGDSRKRAVTCPFKIIYTTLAAHSLCGLFMACGQITETFSREGSSLCLNCFEMRNGGIIRIHSPATYLPTLIVPLAAGNFPGIESSETKTDMKKGEKKEEGGIVYLFAVR